MAVFHSMNNFFEFTKANIFQQYIEFSGYILIQCPQKHFYAKFKQSNAGKIKLAAEVPGIV